MAKEIKDKITLELIIKKINNKEVISKREYRYATIQKTIQKEYINIFQIFKTEEEKIVYRKFDIYGNKINDNYIGKSDITKLITTIKSREVWFFHKKRISAKSQNSKILDENSAKKRVYEWLIKKYKKNIIIPEVSLNNRRVDYIVFGDNVTTIEIKSEIDTLERLESQLKEYSKYSNYIYIALHKNKLKKLEQLDISENIGIIDITTPKIKIIKQPKKIKNTYLSFEYFISYKEYLNLKKSFKGHTKVSKEDFEIFFKEALTKAEKELIIKTIMKTRYIKEDTKRKSLYFDRQYDKSVSSSKNIGINRMINDTEVSLKQILNKSENYLKEYIKKEELKIITLLPKEINQKYKELLIKDSMFFLMIFKKYEIPYQNPHSLLVRLKNIKENIKLLKLIKKDLIKSIISEENKIIKILENENIKKLVEVTSNESLLIIENICKINKINYKIVKQIQNYEIEDFFKEENILLIQKKSFQYYHLSEKIKKIRLYMD